jgi:hypothetical protein
MSGSINVSLAEGERMPHRRGVWPLIAVIGAVLASAPQGMAQAPSGGTPEAAAVANGADLDYVSPDQVFRVLGKDVLSATAENMGRIVDVLFEYSGKPRAAIIDFGGFLGVGTRKIAIDWNALHFDLGEKKKVLVLDLGRDQLKAAPEYKESDKPIAIVTLPRPARSESSEGSGR